MNLYMNLLLGEHHNASRRLGQEVIEFIKYVTGITVSNLDMSDDSIQTCIVNNNLCELVITVDMSHQFQPKVSVQSDDIIGLSVPVYMDECSCFIEIYKEMRLTGFLCEEHLEWQKRSVPSMLPEDSITDHAPNQLSAHSGILRIMEELDNCSSTTQWYKMRYIAPGVRAVNACVLIKADWTSSYTAHILPMHWFDKMYVGESLPTRIEPELLLAWYQVELKEIPHILHFKSNGQS